MNMKWNCLLKKAVFMLTLIGFSFSFWKEKPADAATGPGITFMQPGTGIIFNYDYSPVVWFYNSGAWSYSEEWRNNPKILNHYKKQHYFHENKELLETVIQNDNELFERLMNQTVTDFTEAILLSYTKENPELMGKMLWNGIHDGSTKQLRNLNSQLKEVKCLINKWLNSGAGGESLLPEEKKKIGKLVLSAFTTGKGYLKEVRAKNPLPKPKLLTKKQQKKQQKQKEHDHKQLLRLFNIPTKK